MNEKSLKYKIETKFKAEGVVKKSDVIGAIFGQTEGLLGSKLDLRDLQESGRIGRIEVSIKSKNGKSEGKAEISTSLDASQTALIAASLETVEQIGPCEASMKVKKVQDIREEKREFLIKRAKEILREDFEAAKTKELTSEVRKAARAKRISQYKGLPAGPHVEEAREVLICEGRSDVQNLLSCGITNAIALEGTSVPRQIDDLASKKITTAFVDGDRGGELILEELLQRGVQLDYVAKAPRGKSVEELGKEEIAEALKKEKPASKFKKTKKFEKREKPRLPSKLAEFFDKKLKELTGTRAACFFDDERKLLGRVPVKEMYSAAKEVNASMIVFDGTIDQGLIRLAEKCGLKYIAGMEAKEVKTDTVRIYSLE